MRSRLRCRGGRGSALVEALVGLCVGSVVLVGALAFVGGTAPPLQRTAAEVGRTLDREALVAVLRRDLTEGVLVPAGQDELLLIVRTGAVVRYRRDASGRIWREDGTARALGVHTRRIAVVPVPTEGRVTVDGLPVRGLGSP